MARKRSEQSRLIEFAMKAPLEVAKSVLETFTEIVRQRDPSVGQRKRASRKQAAVVAAATTAGGKSDGTGD